MHDYNLETQKLAELNEILREETKVKLESDLPKESDYLNIRNVICDLEARIEKNKKQFSEKSSKIMYLLSFLQISLSDYDALLNSKNDFSDELILKQEKTIENLQANFDSQSDYFSDLKCKLKNILKKMNEEPSDLLELDFSIDNMKKIQVTFDEKSRLFQENLANLLKTEKAKIEELCCQTATQIDEFPKFTAKPESDEAYLEDLIAISSELEQKKAIVDQISEWHENLIRIEEMDRPSTDPNRFKNRGGYLLEEEKKKKALKRQTTKLLDKITDEVDRFQSSVGKEIKVNDMPFGEFARSVAPTAKKSAVARPAMRDLTLNTTCDFHSTLLEGAEPAKKAKLGR